MSGVTFTEAVRRLPPEQAAWLQAVYRKPAGIAVKGAVVVVKDAIQRSFCVISSDPG